MRKFWKTKVLGFPNFTRELSEYIGFRVSKVRDIAFNSDILWTNMLGASEECKDMTGIVTAGFPANN